MWLRVEEGGVTGDDHDDDSRGKVDDEIIMLKVVVTINDDGITSAIFLVRQGRGRRTSRRSCRRTRAGCRGNRAGSTTCRGACASFSTGLTTGEGSIILFR
jgi:hypothetical protein